MIGECADKLGTDLLPAYKALIVDGPYQISLTILLLFLFALTV